MKVFLTGADGFIGSHLAEELVRNGHQVRALAMYNSIGSLGWLGDLEPEIQEQIDIHLGDVRDFSHMSSLAAGQDAILHLAALIAIPFSYLAPDLYVETNVSGTLNMLKAARDNDVSRFVHASTSEVYGSAKYVPMDEGHPLQGQSPYSASKIGADQMVRAFHSTYGLPTTTVRPFNTFGPRQSSRAVIPSIIAQLAAGKDLVRLGAVTPTRDFSYVTDTAKGFERALHLDSEFGEEINLGAGFEVSILQTFEFIKDLLGSKAEIELDQSRLRPEKSEVDRLFSDNRKASRVLGWRPEFAGAEGFREGLSRTVDWFMREENFAKYRPDVYGI
jgi:NAD dependent epimerase/dehydratase